MDAPQVSAPKEELHPRARVAAWALILVILGTVGGAFLGLYSPDEGNSPPDPASLVVPSAHDLLPMAQAAARRWREDAHLVAIYIDLRPKLEAHFTFDSPSDPRLELGIDVEDPLNAPRLVVDEFRSESRTFVRPSIESYAQAPTDSPYAYAVALDAGGRSFALEHPQADRWFVSLQQLAGGEFVAWRVAFTNSAFEKVAFEVVVDPETGEILDVRQDP